MPPTKYTEFGYIVGDYPKTPLAKGCFFACDTATTTGRLPPRTEVKGTLDYYGDSDLFQINMVAGHTYTVALAAAVGDTNGINLLVYKPGENMGYAPSYPETATGRTTISYKAEASGVYGIGVTSSSRTVGYALWSLPDESDDHGNDAAHATAFLAPGKPVHGAMHVVGDKDWVKVHMDAGQTYAFELQGARTGGGTMETTSTEMMLLRADGLLLPRLQAPASVWTRA